MSDFDMEAEVDRLVPDPEFHDSLACDKFEHEEDARYECSCLKIYQAQREEILAFGRRCREEGQNDIKDKFACDFDVMGDLAWKRGMEEAAKIADAFTLPAHRKMNRDCSLCADVGPHEAIDLTANAIRRRIEERSR